MKKQNTPWPNISPKKQFENQSGDLFFQLSLQYDQTF